LTRPSGPPGWIGCRRKSSWFRGGGGCGRKMREIEGAFLCVTNVASTFLSVK
jgi:hypothetical protein